MLQQEFEKLTGMKVTEKELEKINGMYMNSGASMDKTTFCTDWSTYHQSALLNIFYEQRKRLDDKLDRLHGEKHQTARFLLGKAHEHGDSDLRREAIRLVGECRVVLITLDNHLPLWDEDIQFIKENLRENVSK